ncbi:MAG: nuclear transport factor 2 family protein [Acidimicrobiia bacterium]
MSAHDAVQLLADRDEIHDIVMRYAAGVDRRDMKLVGSCFAPDLEVVGWGGGFTDRDSMLTYISGVAIFHTTMHMFGNQYIEVDGDTAHVDTYAMLTHHSDDANGVTHELNVSRGRYVEDLTRRDGRWVITRRGGDPVWAPTGVTKATTDVPATQWLLDRAEIHDLMMQYALGVDLRDYDRIRNCFASSFRASYGSREFTDADELIEFISGVEHFPSTTHFLGTQLVDVDGDDAWMQTYSLITHRPNEDDPSADWVAAGQYVDRLLREHGRWRIAERGSSARSTRPEPPVAPTTDDPRVQQLLDRGAIHDVIVSSALAMDRENGRTRHFLNNELVAIEGDEATAETYMYVTEQQDDGRPSPWSKGARRWLDRFRRVDRRWVLEERQELSNRVAEELLITADEAATRAGSRRSRDG